jgi:hypothetical protein
MTASRQDENFGQQKANIKAQYSIILRILPMLSLLATCLLLPQLFAGTRPSVPRLAGIVNLPNQKAALLDFSPPGSAPRLLVLRENQRDGDIEVIRINFLTGSVELWPGWTNTPVTVSLQRHGNHFETVAGSLEFVGAGIDPVLSLYAECKGSTLLRWPRLPATSFTLAASTTNQAQAALVLEKALAERGIATIQDGDKFLMVVPESEATAVKPHSSEIKPPTGNGGRSDLVPVGVICFSNADLNQAAQIYAELIGRKLDQTQPLARPTLAINFKNQTPLSKEECAYALDTLFRWQGVKVVPVAQDLARMLPSSDPGSGRDK